MIGTMGSEGGGAVDMDIKTYLRPRGFNRIALG